MDPREDDDFPFDESEDTDPRIRELQTEMVRLQAQLDQLAAATEERAVEMAELRARLDELEVQFATIKALHRKEIRYQVWLGLIYGAAIGMGISFLMRL